MTIPPHHTRPFWTAWLVLMTALVAALQFLPSL